MCLSIYLSLYLFTYLAICLSVYLSICLSVCLSIYLSISVCSFTYPLFYIRATKTRQELKPSAHHVCICVCVCVCVCVCEGGGWRAAGASVHLQKVSNSRVTRQDIFTKIYAWIPRTFWSYCIRCVTMLHTLK
jgi:hypothetical protein